MSGITAFHNHIKGSENSSVTTTIAMNTAVTVPKYLSNEFIIAQNT